MADMRDLLLAAARGQQNVQTGMPIVPNNGNPGGAYNAPTQQDPASGALPTTPMPNEYNPVSGYSWMQPSPSMDLIHQMLSAPIQRTQIPPATTVAPTNVPPMQPAQPMQPTANPVIPAMGGVYGAGTPTAQGVTIIPPMDNQVQMPKLPLTKQMF